MNDELQATMAKVNEIRSAYRNGEQTEEERKVATNQIKSLLETLFEI